MQNIIFRVCRLCLSRNTRINSRVLKASIGKNLTAADLQVTLTNTFCRLSDVDRLLGQLGKTMPIFCHDSCVESRHWQQWKKNQPDEIAFDTIHFTTPLVVCCTNVGKRHVNPAHFSTHTSGLLLVGRRYISGYRVMPVNRVNIFSIFSVYNGMRGGCLVFHYIIFRGYAKRWNHIFHNRIVTYDLTRSVVQAGVKAHGVYRLL